MSLEVLEGYLQKYPDSAIAINLKACNKFRLYNGKVGAVSLVSSSLSICVLPISFPLSLLLLSISLSLSPSETASSFLFLSLSLSLWLLLHSRHFMTFSPFSSRILSLPPEASLRRHSAVSDVPGPWLPFARLFSLFTFSLWHLLFTAPRSSCSRCHAFTWCGETPSALPLVTGALTDSQLCRWPRRS